MAVQPLQEREIHPVAAQSRAQASRGVARLVGRSEDPARLDLLKSLGSAPDPRSTLPGANGSSADRLQPLDDRAGRRLPGPALTGLKSRPTSPLCRFLAVFIDPAQEVP
jgi:hypothetical protein